MTTVAATEFTRNFPAYRDAAQHEPVAVVSHKRVVGYFVSARAFEGYQAFEASRPRTLAIEELDDETLRALATSRMDPRHDHLNDLLD